MCSVLLPPGDNPIAFNKYIIYHINISGKIIKKMPGSVASGTHCITQIRVVLKGLILYAPNILVCYQKCRRVNSIK